VATPLVTSLRARRIQRGSFVRGDLYGIALIAFPALRKNLAGTKSRYHHPSRSDLRRHRDICAAAVRPLGAGLDKAA
jgi:hypothetical protein